MQVSVVYLGGSRVQSGCQREVLELPAGAAVATAVKAIVAGHPDLAPWIALVRWARNHEFVTMDASLEEGDELALLPPVCGGAPGTRLTTEPLEPERVMDSVKGPEIGATVLFVGTVRDHAHGRRISGIEYEAYPEMAERQLERIAGAVTVDRPGCRVAITHRHGRLAVGEVAVVIAAAAPHREDAFAACRDAIERIKQDVPIWKRQSTDDGEQFSDWGGG